MGDSKIKTRRLEKRWKQTEIILQNWKLVKQTNIN